MRMLEALTLMSFMSELSVLMIHHSVTAPTSPPPGQVQHNTDYQFAFF